MPAAMPPVRAPRQARARRTLEKLLDVTEALLETRSFEKITVGEIVRGAGTSVGAFYARFRDKDALLPALYERYDAWIRERAERVERDEPWKGLDLEQTVHWHVGQLIEMFHERRYLLRAMTLLTRLRPEKVDDASRERRRQQMGFLHRALLECRDEIGHPDPERAVELAVYMAASLCREWLLFGDSPHAKTTGASETEVAREIERQMLGYLRLP